MYSRDRLSETLGQRFSEQGAKGISQVDVILLVTGPHADAARQFRRIHSAAEQRRLKTMVADWQSVDLGLSGHEVQRLTHRVTHIFHAVSDPSGSVRTQRARLAGLRQFMRLARDCERLERFCFFSTASSVAAVQVSFAKKS